MLFVLICTDKPARLDLRLASRPQHLAYLQTYQSKLMTAGALLDTDDRPCGSLLVIDVADRAEAEGFAEADPLQQIRAVRERGDPSVSPGVQGWRPGSVNYWLVKSEPESFSWDQQVANDIEPWTGVRSFQARNNLKAMEKGDRAFFYHSNKGKEIVGVVKVVRTAYPDPSAGPGDWVCVDMKTVGPVKRPVTLAEMKADPQLEGLSLLRLSRLSVAPVSPEHWAYLCKLSGFRDR